MEISITIINCNIGRRQVSSVQESACNLKQVETLVRNIQSNCIYSYTKD